MKLLELALSAVVVLYGIKVMFDSFTFIRDTLHK